MPKEKLAPKLPAIPADGTSFRPSEDAGTRRMLAGNLLDTGMFSAGSGKHVTVTPSWGDCLHRVLRYPYLEGSLTSHWSDYPGVYESGVPSSSVSA